MLVGPIYQHTRTKLEKTEEDQITFVYEQPLLILKTYVSNHFAEEHHHGRSIHPGQLAAPQ